MESWQFATDLPCDILYIYVLPEMARTASKASFLQFERNLGLASVVLANGAYTLCVAAMVIRLKQIGGADHAISVLGGITVACGLLMCAASIANDPQLLKYATGPTILAFSLWCVFVCAGCRGNTCVVHKWAHMKAIVFGGYGVFGSLVARDLATAGISVIIAGRDRKQAEKAARALPGAHKGIRRRCA